MDWEMELNEGQLFFNSLFNMREAKSLNEQEGWRANAPLALAKSLGSSFMETSGNKEYRDPNVSRQLDVVVGDF